MLILVVKSLCFPLWTYFQKWPPYYWGRILKYWSACTRSLRLLRINHIIEITEVFDIIVNFINSFRPRFFIFIYEIIIQIAFVYWNFPFIFFEIYVYFFIFFRWWIVFIAILCFCALLFLVLNKYFFIRLVWSFTLHFRWFFQNHMWTVLFS